MTTPETTIPSAGTAAAAPDELPPTYDPKAVEAELYTRWMDAGVFTADRERSARVGGDREPFVIVMPPPNVTAVLHMGHGLDNTVQDVLIRWRRMAGDEALWVPGTDHAGIATQNVIEKQLAAEGKSRYDLGREAFVERTKCFVAETGGVILKQLRAIGASADWTRTGYTFSPELSRAVREAFVRLFEAGLVYKGHRVIHWCPRCLTSLSDEEAEPKDEPGKLYHVRYLVEGDPSRALTIATTRPETMLADVAIAVNPADERYRDLVGKNVILPVLDLAIPVIADEYADPEFGTGAVKITPAHDANDFEVGKRHALAMPVVIDAEGIVREVQDADGRVPAFLAGKDRFEARTLMVKRLEETGALAKIEQRDHAVRHCYRCDTVVEPRLSDQWFVKMAPLAKPALEARQDGRVRILPERWEAVYDHWLSNIRDWNISRQLWWGHRIPVWYCENEPDGEPIVARDDPSSCPRCGGPVRQDEDVLDTWFSSWLWPISTLGWPDDDAPDLAAFYPTDVLVSGPDILFFWISRMIMSGFFFKGETPYHTVYLHGIARDTQHRKMSKSLGNGIDPLEVVEKFGADALRFTVVAGMGMGVDIIFDPDDLEKSFAVGRNFATKLWNIGRFLLRSVGAEAVEPLASIDPDRLARSDRWILARLNAAIERCDAALGPARPSHGRTWSDAERPLGLRLNEYAEAARQFVWNELADWYVEAVKGRVTSVGQDRDVARAVLVHCFDRALRLLHPIVPFITETLWQRLPSSPEGAFLARAAWPSRDDIAGVPEGAADFELVREAVSAVRQLRSEYNLSPSTVAEAVLVPGENQPAGVRQLLEHEAPLVGRLTRSNVRVESSAPGGAAAHAVLSGGASAVLPLAGLIDVDKERKRLHGELENLDKQLASLRGRLANENFTSRAKPEVVEAERQKEREWSVRRDGLAAKVAALGGA